MASSSSKVLAGLTENSEVSNSGSSSLVSTSSINIVMPSRIEKRISELEILDEVKEEKDLATEQHRAELQEQQANPLFVSTSNTISTSISSFFPATLIDLITEYAIDPQWQAEKKQLREWFLEGNKTKALEILQKYENNPAALRELLFEPGTIEYKDAAEEKFGANREFTRIHDGKSAWELMLWSHTYDVLFKPLKKFFSIADPSRGQANSHTPQHLSELEPSFFAVDQSTKDREEAALIAGLIQGVSADSCEKGKAQTTLLAYTLTLGSRPNIQLLLKTYNAYVQHTKHGVWDWDYNRRLSVIWAHCCSPVLFSLPPGFSSLVGNLQRAERAIRPTTTEGVITSAWSRDTVHNNFRSHLLELCEEKTEAFNQILDWLRGPSQTLDNNQNLGSLRTHSR